MHSISVVLAHNKVATKLADLFTSAKVVELPQDIGLVPLTDALIKEINGASTKSQSAFKEFEFLTKPVLGVLLDLSVLGKTTYIETEYFGGTGVQSSVVWENETVIYGPKISKDYRSKPINEALKHLGVRLISKHDEFDEIGLGRNRSTEKWYANNS